MKRAEFPRRVKLAVWDRAGGACEHCQRKLFPGDRWEYDHVIPAAIKNDASEANCELLCRGCHLAKYPGDARTIAKSRSVRAAHVGARKAKHKIPGSKGTGLRKRMNGEVVRVDE